MSKARLVPGSVYRLNLDQWGVAIVVPPAVTFGNVTAMLVLDDPTVPMGTVTLVVLWSVLGGKATKFGPVKFAKPDAQTVSVLPSGVNSKRSPGVLVPKRPGSGTKRLPAASKANPRGSFSVSPLMKVVIVPVGGEAYGL